MPRKLLHFDYDGTQANIDLENLSAFELADLLVAFFYCLPREGRAVFIETLSQLNRVAEPKADLVGRVAWMVARWRKSPTAPAGRG